MDAASYHTEGSESSSIQRTVLCKDLPHLLGEFERKRGAPLVEDDSRAQLDEFCRQIPDQPIARDDLVNMITNLDSAREVVSAVQASASSSDDQGSTDGDHTDSMSEASANSGPLTLSDLRSSTPPEMSFKAPHQPFPRSQSESFDLTPNRDKEHRGKKRQPHISLSSLDTLRTRSSSPSAVDDSVATLQGQSKQRSRVDSAGEGRDIFRGKGRAPPSSWQRPRPQALASRSRRTSELSSAGGAAQEDESLHSPPRRSRQTSQPIAAEAAALNQPPRSVSSGYIFPRATSPGSNSDRWYEEQEEQWERDSTDQDRSSNNISRAASPDIDSSSFQPFAALGSPHSPASAQMRQGLASSTSARSIYDTFGHEAEEVGALQRRYDNLLRTLQEKERTFESTQSTHETTIADLEAKVEQLQDRIHTSTRANEEMKQKEQRYLDEISRLESDLATSQKRGDKAERVKEVMQADLTYRETSIANLQGRVKELQERIASIEREAAGHVARQSEWEQDREQYRSQIEQLRSDLRLAVEKEAKMEELESEREALRAQLRDVHAELEEARRGSGFLPHGRGDDSRPPTLSRKAGSSLGSELRGVWSQLVDNQKSEDDDAIHEESEGEHDASLESVTVTTTRRRRQGPPRVLTEGFAQTEDEGDHPKSFDSATDGAHPPSYDEAALEESLLKRSHPDPVETNEPERGDQLHLNLLNMLKPAAGADQTASSHYGILSQQLGIRCTVMESAMERRRNSSGSASPETSSTGLLQEATNQIAQLWPSRGRRHRTRKTHHGESLSELQTKVLIMLGGGFLIGLCAGSLLFGGRTYLYFYSGSPVVEDSQAWQWSNSLNLGLGGSGIEYAPDPCGAAPGLLSGLLGQWWMKRSARAPGRVFL